MASSSNTGASSSPPPLAAAHVHWSLARWHWYDAPSITRRVSVVSPRTTSTRRSGGRCDRITSTWSSPSVEP
jgi:hypothetical protein